MEVSTADLEQRRLQVQELEATRGGFCFHNARRNEMIMANAADAVAPRAMKTGTTIVGCRVADCVVLGADTRATGGDEVCDKNCAKIHYMTPTIYCCGAGTAADTEMVTQMISSQLELLALNTKSPARVATACTLLKRRLFRYHGHIGAALILGGVDATGTHLYEIHPHGSDWQGPYLCMGSGSLAAMAVMETQYREDLDEAGAVELVKNAILAGVFNDLGSGSNVDVTVIRRNGEVVQTRGVEKPNDVAPLRARYERPAKLVPRKGTTYVLEESFVPHPAPAERPVAVPAAAATAEGEVKMET